MRRDGIRLLADVQAVAQVGRDRADAFDEAYRIDLHVLAVRGRSADVTKRRGGAFRAATGHYCPKCCVTVSFSRAAEISPMCDSTRLPFASKKSVVGSPREP